VSFRSQIFPPLAKTDESPQFLGTTLPLFKLPPFDQSVTLSLVTISKLKSFSLPELFPHFSPSSPLPKKVFARKLAGLFPTSPPDLLNKFNPSLTPTSSLL